MPNNVYQLSDWKNAVKMQNALNPNIKIDILELQDNAGYILTVFEEGTAKDSSSNLLYRVPVECTLQNNWSLSNEEAVILLNTIGFPCEWVPTTVIPDSAKEQLEYLKSFGWTNIIRFIRPAEVHVLNNDVEHAASLAAIIPNFNYKDWEFLTTGIPTPIQELLDSVDNVGQSQTE